MRYVETLEPGTFTLADLDGLPDDGMRYELVDGVLLVTPAPLPIHLVLKRRLYEEAGVTSYWIFDPAKEELTVLELAGGTYEQRAVVTGKEAFDAELPFPVRIVPADLVDQAVSR